MGKARSIPVQGLAAAPARPDERFASPCLPSSCIPGRDWQPFSPRSIRWKGFPNMKPAAHSRRGVSLAMLLASMLLAATPVALGKGGEVGAEAASGKAADPVA